MSGTDSVRDAAMGVGILTPSNTAMVRLLDGLN